MIYLRQSTDSQEIALGYFLDSSDGDTEETGLTIANTDILLHKTGATTLASKNSGGATHISNGIYYATLDATDTDTLGSMIIFVHVSGALTVRLECVVFPANIYDSWILGTDYQQVDTVQLEGSDATTQILDSVVNDSTQIDASALNTLSGHDPGETIMGATDLVNLADDAITSAKYDETTAFPIKSDDSGSTQIARVGADGDTLETLSDQLDAVPTAAENRTEMDSNSTQLTAIVGDTNELQTDWTNGGRLDLLLDAIKVVTDSITDLDTLVDAVWDEILTAATHNISTSAGRRLRELAGNIIRSETAQGAGTGNNQIQLDSSASATDGAYDPSMICIINGTGVGQSRLILQYDGSTKVATVDRDWKTNPDATSEFVIYGHPGREHVNEGLAQAGASNTITLNTLASSIDDSYVGQTVFIRSGTGQDQAKIITAYNGTTKVATVASNWGTNPDTTSGYVVLGQDNYILSTIVAAFNNLSSADVTTACTSSLNTYDPPTNAEMTAAFAALNDLSSSEVGDAVLDEAVEGTYTLRQAMRIMLSALAGILSGAATTTITVRDVNDTTDRIVATVDEDGNRSAVTLDGD